MMIEGQIAPTADAVASRIDRTLGSMRTGLPGQARNIDGRLTRIEVYLNGLQ